MKNRHIFADYVMPYLFPLLLIGVLVIGIFIFIKQYNINLTNNPYPHEYEKPEKVISGEQYRSVKLDEFINSIDELITRLDDRSI